MRVISILLVFCVIIFSYYVLRFESLLFFLFLLLSAVLLLYFRFYEKNLNHIFVYSDGKVFVHTFLNVYVFNCDNAYVKSGGKGINSYFCIYDTSTNQKVKFDCLFFGIKRFEILKEQLKRCTVAANNVL